MGCSGSTDQPIRTSYSLQPTNTNVDNNTDEFYLYKILVIGDSSVGKSSLLLRFIDNSFSSNFLATIGVDFKLKQIMVREVIVKLQIWDTAGQERFRNITRSYYRGAHGIMIVYDVTNEQSFKNVELWLREVNKYATPSVYKILVANKCDLIEERVISVEDGKGLGERLNMEFLETSAKDSINVNEAFWIMGETLLKRK